MSGMAGGYGNGTAVSGNPRPRPKPAAKPSVVAKTLAGINVYQGRERSWADRIMGQPGILGELSPRCAELGCKVVLYERECHTSRAFKFTLVHESWFGTEYHELAMYFSLYPEMLSPNYDLGRQVMPQIRRHLVSDHNSRYYEEKDVMQRPEEWGRWISDHV